MSESTMQSRIELSSSSETSSSVDVSELSSGRLSASGRPLPERWLVVVATAWVGFALTMFTSMAASYVAVWYVIQSTESAFALAVVYVFAFLPQGLFSPLGGLAADRFNRRTVIIVADVSVALVELVAGILVLLGNLSFGLIVVLLMLCSVAQAFRTPSFNAVMPMMVPEEHLLRINTLDSILSSAAMICAPVLGIFLYTTLGFQAVMFLAALGAGAAALTMSLVHIPNVRSQGAEGKRFLSNITEGFVALSSKRGLLILMIAITFGMMAYGPIDSMLPLTVSTQFNGDGYMASLIAGVFGIGMLIGSAALMVLGNGKHLVRIIFAASLVVGVAAVVIGFLPSSMFAAFAVAVGVMAAACAGFSGPTMTLLQRHVDEDKLGRVMGLFMMCVGLSIPIGTVLGGALAQCIGVENFFVIDGIIILVLGVAIVASRRVRKLDGE